MDDLEAKSNLQADLLRRIAAQDREALAQFYDQNAGIIYATALRMLGDVSEAARCKHQRANFIFRERTRRVAAFVCERPAGNFHSTTEAA